MSVRWFCPDCSSSYTSEHKICQKCHALLHYHCLLSNQKGRYDHFIRHQQHCIYSTPTLIDKQRQEKKEFHQDTQYEMKQADKSKSKKNIHNNFPLCCMVGTYFFFISYMLHIYARSTSIQ